MNPAISNGVNLNMSTANILASVIFGSIGFAAFLYGKKQSSLKAMVIGILLMVYPYFIPNTVAAYAIGTALVLALWFFPG